MTVRKAPEMETPPAERDILEAVKRFAEECLEPVAAKVDETETLPPETLREMAGMGLFGLMILKEHGGIYESRLLYYRVIEQIAKSCASHALTLLSHSMCAHGISEFGSPYQKERYLPGLGSGKRLGGVGMTEKEAGSDLGAVQTTAEKCEDGYVLNGEKRYVTNGGLADVFIVLASTSQGASAFGQSLFVVEKDMEGFRPGKRDNKMGFRGADTRDLILEGVKLSDWRLIGKTGQAMLLMSRIFETSRVATAALALGLAEKGFQLALEYAKKRKQFGKAVARFGVIQNYLADMYTETTCARLLIERTASLQETGKPAGKEASAAKYYASEAALRVLSSALQIHGGRGYMKECRVERLFRDARLCTIIEGTSEIQKRIIARYL